MVHGDLNFGHSVKINISQSRADIKNTGSCISSLNQLPETAVVEDILEAIISWLQLSISSEIFGEAKENYFNSMGKVFPEDSFYEQRINYFLDILLLERPIKFHENPAEKSLKTPFELFMESAEFKQANVSRDMRSKIESIGAFRHSVYQIDTIGNGVMQCHDLLDGIDYKIKSKHGETFRGFSKKDIFQGFIFPQGDVAYLSLGVFVHPKKAQKIIMKLIKKGMKATNFEGENLLKILAQKQLKHHRHANIDPRYIYEIPL